MSWDRLSGLTSSRSDYRPQWYYCGTARHIYRGDYALLISYGERVISLPDSKATDNARKPLSNKLDSGFCYSVIILLRVYIYIHI